MEGRGRPELTWMMTAVASKQDECCGSYPCKTGYMARMVLQMMSVLVKIEYSLIRTPGVSRI